MTTPHLANDISAEEGFRSKAYPDPLTGGPPWTCGFGCTGPDVGPTTRWSRAEAVARRDRKIAEAVAELDRNAPWWRSMCDARQDVLVSMAYNMGWPRLSGFKRALAAMKAHDYGLAAAEMLDSDWARKQVPARARRLAAQMRTGERVGGL